METLIRNLNHNENIKNINILGKGISKVTAYADDIALLTKDIPSIVNSLKTYEKFSTISGLFINPEKTEIMNLKKYINNEVINVDIYGSPVIINSTDKLPSVAKHSHSTQQSKRDATSMIK